MQAEEVRIRGTVLMLDAPSGLQCGVDWMEWEVGPLFAGVKLLPMGVHYVFTRRTEAPGSPAQGWWLYVPSSGEGALLSLRWDTAGEEFVALPPDDRERLAAAVNRMEFDSRLGAYSQQAGEENSHFYPFSECSNHVTAHHVEWLQRTSADDRREVLSVGRQSYDRSPELFLLLESNIDILAWLESSHIEYSLVHSLEAFEVWRDVILLLCDSETALRSHTPLFEAFVGILTRQLRMTGPAVFFSDECGNRLVSALGRLVRDVDQDDSLEAELRASVARLAREVPQLEEDEEDGPVVVDLS